MKAIHDSGTRDPYGYPLRVEAIEAVADELASGRRLGFAASWLAPRVYHSRFGYRPARGSATRPHSSGKKSDLFSLKLVEGFMARVFEPIETGEFSSV